MWPGRGGSRLLLLGHLKGECFGLFFVRGRQGRCIGLYDFDMLRRGDLGEVLAGAGHGLGERGSRGEGDVVGGDGGQRGQAQRAREPASQRPRPPPHQTVAFKSGPRSQVANPQPRQRKPAPPRAGLSPEEKQRIDIRRACSRSRGPAGARAHRVGGHIGAVRRSAGGRLGLCLVRGEPRPATGSGATQVPSACGGRRTRAGMGLDGPPGS